MRSARRLAALALGLLICRAPATAWAQTPAELDDARRLFTEALKDEEKKSFDVALEKFKRVQGVRDAPAVRYRIGACLESLGRIQEARDMFEAIVQKRASASSEEAEILRSAASRTSELAARVPLLTLHLSARAPLDAEVRVDDRVIPRTSLDSAIALNPGEHTIDGNAKGSAPFHGRVSLPERGRVELTVALDPAGTPAALHDDGASTAPARSNAAETPVLGIAALAGGGALVVASVVTLLMRHGEIAALESACPGGACPAARRDELTDARSRALVEGPLGVALGAAGLVAIGVGAYLVLTHGRAPASVAPVTVGLVPHGGVLRFGGAF